MKLHPESQSLTNKLKWKESATNNRDYTAEPINTEDQAQQNSEPGN